MDAAGNCLHHKGTQISPSADRLGADEQGLIKVDEIQFGDRRTVVGREHPVFAGLEYGSFFDVPHRASIKIS